MECLSAAQAAGRAVVRPSMVTRWAQSGKLPAQRLESGTLQIAEADLDVFLPLRAAAPRAMPADAAVALAVAQERIRGLEELVALEREWRTMAEERLALVQASLPAAPVVLALGKGLGPLPPWVRLWERQRSLGLWQPRLCSYRPLTPLDVESRS